MRTLSLRARLLGAVLGLLAVAAVVIAVVTTAATHDFLVGQLDDELGASTGRFESRLPPGGLPPVPVPGGSPLGPGQQAGTIGVVVRDGQVLASSVVLRDGSQQPVPDTALPTLLALNPDGGPRSVDLGPLGDYRTDATRAASGDRLVIGLPERALQDTVTRLVVVETAVLVATLLGVAVAGAFVVRRELRPLERVAATAARVTELPLDRGEVSLADRVPVGDPGTEIGQVGTALNRMLDHVGDALEARQISETRVRRFVADASHELRTPLASIRGYAELMRRSDLADTDVHSLSRISSQAERMTALVEDLLLLARLDAGRPLEQGEVDLTRLTLDAVGDARVSGPGHVWRLVLPDEPVTVAGDTSRLAQVLANLLVNARTHTPPGTVVAVTLADDGAQVQLRVTDDGPGIPAALVPHVFERFARGSTSRSREHGSTGLGLSIVDAVVTAHRGTVRVVSRAGRTEFTVTLPTDGR